MRRQSTKSRELCASPEPAARDIRRDEEANAPRRHPEVAACLKLKAKAADLRGMLRAMIAGMVLAAGSPAAPIASLLGTPIQEADLRGAGISGLLNHVMQRFGKHYLKANRIEPTEAELGAMRKKFADAAAKRPRGEPRRAEVEQFAERIFVVGTVENFKLHRALWLKHGGRLALSAFTGVYAAPDALAEELRGLESQGQFEIPDPKRREEFYRYLLGLRGDGVVEGERAREILASPPWN